MRCLLVENYSNSRQVWSSRSFLQFLWGLRPNSIRTLSVVIILLRSVSAKTSLRCCCSSRRICMAVWSLYESLCAALRHHSLYGQCDMAIPTRPVMHEFFGESKLSTHTHIPFQHFANVNLTVPVKLWKMSSIYFQLEQKELFFNVLHSALSVCQGTLGQSHGRIAIPHRAGIPKPGWRTKYGRPGRDWRCVGKPKVHHRSAVHGGISQWVVYFIHYISNPRNVTQYNNNIRTLQIIQLFRAQMLQWQCAHP